MDQIHANSSCTIAATIPADGSEGLDFDRNVHQVTPAENNDQCEW